MIWICRFPSPLIDCQFWVSRLIACFSNFLGRVACFSYLLQIFLFLDEWWSPLRLAFPFHRVKPALLVLKFRHDISAVLFRTVAWAVLKEESCDDCAISYYFLAILWSVRDRIDCLELPWATQSPHCDIDNLDTSFQIWKITIIISVSLLC